MKKIKGIKAKKQKSTKTKKSAPYLSLKRLANEWSKFISPIPLSIIAADRRAAASKNS